VQQADMQGTLRKTLIIRFSSVGDIVLSTPLIRALRRRFPHGQLDFLARSEYAELLRDNPNLTTVHEFPEGGSLDDIQRLRAAIVAAGYDLILDIHGSLRSRILCRGLKNVVRVRKRVFPRFLLVHFKVDLYRFFGGAPGVADRYLETAGLLADDDGEGPELFPSPAAFVRTKEFLGGLAERVGIAIGICPSARHATKIWPAERFAAVAATVGKNHAAEIILFGSSAEAGRCLEITDAIHALDPGVSVLDLSGKLSLMETAAAMDRCDVIVTNDSGLMHIAGARKRKIVALFGSTVRQFGFFPPPARSIVLEQHGLRCRPCTHIGRAACPLGHFRCMMEITEARAVAAVNALLET
jgi:lipopolysaccharide heptosyltransferase II